MDADDKYYKAVEKELNSFCDTYFKDDAEMRAYCLKCNIPFEEDGELAEAKGPIKFYKTLFIMFIAKFSKYLSEIGR